MKIYTHISCVDGETNISTRNTSPKAIREFLEQYDHEGSDVILSIDIETENIYDFLKYLEGYNNG